MKTEWIVLVVLLSWTLLIRADDTPCSADGSSDREGQNASFICANPRNRVGPHKTFTSRCALATYNCRNKNDPYIYRHDGPCNNEPNNACRHTCASSDKPVCGGPISGSGRNITFSSVCELENYNCDYSDAKYRVVDKGRCEDIECRRTCQREESPLCAGPRFRTGDFKTFKSRCELENYNCDHRLNEYEIVSAGPCADNPASHCRTCPSEHHPICSQAPNNAIGKTFENQCQLERFNCLHNTNYEYKHNGKCAQSCNHACLQTYKPVCAASLRGDKPPRTFHNQCFLEQHNCEADIAMSDDIFHILYTGQCQVEPTTTSRPVPQCPKVCPRIAAQVCASPSSNPNLQKTFFNRCELDNHNCVEPHDEYRYIHDGKCNTGNTFECRIRLCSREVESPVCARPRSNTGENMEFTGNCSLHNFNCLHPDSQYEFYRDGGCPSLPITCKEPCSAEEAHICGQSQFFRSTMTFRNQCEMKNYNCDHGILGTYEFLHHGKCRDEVSPNPPFEPVCRNNCSDAYEPVCATPIAGMGLKREFHNLCRMELYNCEHFLLKYKVLHAGRCTPVSPNAPIVNCHDIRCNTQYQPICGVSQSILGLHKTFSNRCMMDVYNCEHETDQYQFHLDGECKPLIPPPSPGLNCIKDCECTYNPVCTKPRYGNGPKREFTNRCKLDNYNCENYLDPHDVLYVGKCGIITPPVNPNGPKSCIRDCECDYRPVCATPVLGMGPPITFTNRCKFNNHNCEFSGNQYQVLHEGECPKSEKIVMPSPNLPDVHIPAIYDCFRECPQDYTPVCGQMRSDVGLSAIKRTFRNRCDFENHNCLFTLTKYDHLHNRACADPPIVF